MTRSSLVAAFLLATFALAAPANAQFSMPWYTIDGGGGASSGGGFTLTGTIGQPDAGGMSGGPFQLFGGFWRAAEGSPQCPSDFNRDGFVDPLDYNGYINAFEAGDMAADFNLDGFLDPLDYNGYINAFEAGC